VSGSMAESTALTAARARTIIAIFIVDSVGWTKERGPDILYKWKERNIRTRTERLGYEAEHAEKRNQSGK
jgi:hypothetical protein